MRIHIKLMDRGWIFEYAANMLKQLTDNTIHKITISEYALDDADVNLYFNWHGLTSKTKGLDIPYFTHYETRLYKDVLPRLKLADGIICMSNEGYRMLRMITDRPIWIIPLGYDKLVVRRIVIGISGRTYMETDRKGESDLKYIVSGLSTIEKDFLSFLFLGTGWDDISTYLVDRNIPCRLLRDATDLTIKSTFYQSIDYYLSLGLDEGGPQGILDAFATGVPVISTPVGYSFDLIPDYTFSHVEQLSAIIKQLIKAKTERMVKVKDYTWENFASNVIKFCERVPSVIEEQRKEKELQWQEERKQYS